MTEICYKTIISEITDKILKKKFLNLIEKWFESFGKVMIAKYKLIKIIIKSHQ